MTTAAEDPAIKASLLSLGSEPAPSSPARAHMVKREIERWSSVVAKAAIQPA
ncbi:MAG: hypothetical protein ABI887_00830 [Burkholderiales bacterium]